MNDLAKNFVLLIVVLFVLFSVFRSFGTDGPSTPEVLYTDFLDDVSEGFSMEATVEGERFAVNAEAGQIKVSVGAATFSIDPANAA